MVNLMASPSQIISMIRNESTLLHQQLSDIVQLLREIKEALNDRNRPPF